MIQLEALPKTHQNHLQWDESILNKIKSSVDDLYALKNKFLNEWADKFGMLNDSASEVWMKADNIHSMIMESCELNKNKNEITQSKFEDTVSIFKEYESAFIHAPVLDKAEFCYQYGKAFNAIDSDLYAGSSSSSLHDMTGHDDDNDFTSPAVHWLTKALKFNPQHLEAWCELGDSCWRQGDPCQAADHFRQALKIDPKHVKALCNLSMVLRQPPNTTTNISENIDNISSYEADKSKSLSSSSPSSSPTSDTTMKCSIFHQSVNLAHKAVSQQPTNGYAWSVLGNALLTLFFKSFSSTTTSTTVSSSDQNSSINKSPLISSSPQLIMTRCIAAYAQAVKDRSIALEPNFHYNRGLAWHYQDLFGQTLKCWLQALCLDPEWPAPQYGIKRIIKFIMEWHKLMKQFHKKQSIHVHFTEIESNQIESSYGTLKTSPINHESSVDTQQMINEDEFISPLSPLKKLIVTTVLESSNTINPDSSTSNNNSNNDVVLDQSDISQNALSLNPKEISGLNRLLGPYCPFSDNDKNKSGSNFQTKRSSTGSKKKKQLKASKYSSNNNNSNDTLTDSSKTNDNPLNSLVNSHCLQFTPFNNLQVGLNKNTVCIGRVFAELPNDSDLALNLLLIDPYGTPFAVRLYNVGKGVGPTRKDIIAIPHPFVEEILIEGFVLHACLNALSIIDNQYLSDMIEKFSYLRTSTATTTTTDNEVSSNGSSSANCTKSESNTQSSNDETTINLPNQLMNLHMRVIRVPLPNFLVVNGQTVGSSWTAVPVLKNIFFA